MIAAARSLEGPTTTRPGFMKSGTPTPSPRDSGVGSGVRGDGGGARPVRARRGREGQEEHVGDLGGVGQAGREGEAMFADRALEQVFETRLEDGGLAGAQ